MVSDAELSQLLTDAAAGDDEAREELIGLYLVAIVRSVVLTLRVPSFIDYDDLIQDALVVCISKLHRANPDRKPRAYFAVVARRAALRIVKNENRVSEKHQRYIDHRVIGTGNRTGPCRTSDHSGVE